MANDPGITFKPDTAVRPGDTLLETLEELDISQAELARRTGRPAKTINEIIKGKAAITPDTAIQLEHALGIAASFWNNLERNYREALARLREERHLRPQLTLVDRFPCPDIARHGFMKHAADKMERARELLRFFRIDDLRRLPALEPAAYRTSRTRSASPEALASWLRIGEIEARRVETRAFDHPRFRRILRQTRQMTRRRPEEFEGELRSRCADCGVALVIFPQLTKTYANGATRWLSSSKVLLQLSIRYKYSDIFWFSFYHEAGHILLHGKRKSFADVRGMKSDKLEQQADTFAADMLIPPKEYRAFLERGNPPSEGAVKAFAEQLGIGPGIVVGRLQHDQIIARHQMLHLRPKLEWAESN